MADDDDPKGRLVEIADYVIIWRGEERMYATPRRLITALGQLQKISKSCQVDHVTVRTWRLVGSERLTITEFREQVDQQKAKTKLDRLHAKKAQIESEIERLRGT